MFFIFPVGHSNSTVRRKPWVSHIIIAVNILIFFLFTQNHTNLSEVHQYVEDISYHIKIHPEVELSPALQEVLSEHFLEEYEKSKKRSQETTAKLRQEGLTGGLAHLDRLTDHLEGLERSDAQDELDKLTEKLLALEPGGVYKRWGYIPSREGHRATLVTTLFFHSGLMHLLGNMILFFLCAPFVEDRWGRILFTIFYLSSGVVAALCYGFLTGSPDIPLIGASGAIAGVMGAFLILFFHTKIKFLYFFFFGFRLFKGTFLVPSYVVLPLWFGQQYYHAMTSGNSSVAFWAHVGGFSYGLTIAIMIKLLTIEERYISPHIDRQITYYEAHPLLEKAVQKWAEGQPQQAIKILNHILKQTPCEINILHTLLEIYSSLEDNEGVKMIGSKLIDIYIQQNDLDQAKEIYNNMKINDCHIYPVTKTLFNMATVFESHRETENANKAYKKIILNDPDDLLALKSLVKLARFNLEVEKNHVEALKYFVMAKHHPTADSNVAGVIAEGIERSRHAGGPEVARMDEAAVDGAEQYTDMVNQ